MKLKFANALSLALILAMFFTSIGFADTITPDADTVTVGDQATRNFGTVTPGQVLTPTVSFKLVCNGQKHIDNGQTVSLTFTLAGSTVPAGGSLSATNASIGAIPSSWPDDPASGNGDPCPSSPPVLGDNGDSAVTITAPSAPGSYTYVVKYNVGISPAGNQDNSSITGSAPVATFTLTVPTPPSNTAPSVSVTGVTHGASYNKGSVPAAMCSVTDTQDGNSSFVAPLTSITGPYASDGIGSQTANCSYTDAGGLTASASATYSIVDPSAPSISYVVTAATPDGNNGWYKSNVTLTWTVSEPQSPNSLAKTGCMDQNITSDQNATTYSCSATSSGGSAGPVSVSIKRDATAPVITFSGPSTSSWYGADVTANWTCSDALSGAVSNSVNVTTTGEGSTVLATGTCTDNAGNSASDTQSFQVDKTGPSITANATKADSSAYTADTWTNQDITVDFICQDAGSGVATCTGDATYDEEGTFTASGSATDNVGNTSSTSFGPIKIDKTAPTITGTATTTPNANGWYNGDVTIHWTCSDALSGLNGSCPADSVITGEGSNLSANESISDLAGNSASATVSGIKIDRTAPTANTSASPAANANGWNNSDVTVSFIGADGLSGIDACSAAQVFGEGAGQTASGTCTDKAGNVSTPATATVNVDKTAPSISGVADRAANAAGWYNADVIVSFSCSDVLSGVDSCSGPQTLGEGANQSDSGTVTDKAGNSANTTVSGINIDKTKPIISAAATTSPNGNGWYNSDVTVHFTCDDGLSGIPTGTCPDDQSLSTEGAAVASTEQTVTDAAGNTSDASNVVTVKIDKTAPAASASASPAANSFGWNNTNVTISFTGNDGSGSGIDFCDAGVTLSTEGAGQSASGVCTDKAGNVSPSASASANIDKTNPLVSLVGGPANGGTYYFGFVPAAPTCSASDALSGIDGNCSLSGYSGAIGSHTVSANATDKAENSGSTSVSYTINAWTLNGFYQPVDMKGIYNTVKGGSTVPLKFEIFAGATEVTNTSAISSLTAAKVACSGGGEDAIEITATGGTSLRYDTVAGQFIYNWKTPTGAGTCYKVTMTTADGSSLVAFFKLK